MIRLTVNDWLLSSSCVIEVFWVHEHAQSSLSYLESSKFGQSLCARQCY